MGKWLVIVLFSWLAPAPVFAQATDRQPPPPHVTAIGEAVIMVEPDQAEIDIGVVTQAKNAPNATRENAEKLSRVMAEINKILGKSDEVKTASYSLTPNYRYPQGGKPELVGYTATNILRIKTGTLSTVGKLIDAGMQSGANTINRLAFTLKDEQNAQLQALRLAAAKARAKAEEMASALGLKLMKILSVTESGQGVRPPVPLVRAAQMEALAAAPTPVEAGTIEVRSSVTLTAEVGPR
jgi:uncharacterized protein YggE